MSGPSIDRANSSGDIWTPKNFRAAVVQRFGEPTVDLAANDTNYFGKVWITEAEDSLRQGWNAPSWRVFKGARANPLLWLNPPFSHITPWVYKCATEWKLGAEILLLVPASVGANWYWDYVEPYAQVYSVGRMVFDNCFDRKTGKLVTTPYAKDLILAHYVPGKHGNRMERWRWL